jgi:hypothetical protein
MASAPVMNEKDNIVYAQVIESAVPFGTSTTSATLQDDFSVMPVTPQQKQLLRAMDIPDGLIDCLVQAHETSARRYWIVDNSGSMNTQDGKRLLNKSKLVSCSRWEELGDSLRWQGQVASILGAHTEFRMLNHTRTLTKMKYVVGAAGMDQNLAIEELNQAIKSTPASGTPLCAALRQVLLNHIINISHPYTYALSLFLLFIDLQYYCTHFPLISHSDFFLS